MIKITVTTAVEYRQANASATFPREIPPLVQSRVLLQEKHPGHHPVCLCCNCTVESPALSAGRSDRFGYKLYLIALIALVNHILIYCTKDLLPSAPQQLPYIPLLQWLPVIFHSTFLLPQEPQEPHVQIC